MRTGALSDEAVMQMCAEFRPVPLGATKLLTTDQPKADHQHNFKAPKYTQPPPRPSNYYAMSNSMAKHMDPTNEGALLDRLNKRYMEELPTIRAFPAVPPTDNTAMVVRLGTLRDMGIRYTTNVVRGGTRIVVQNSPGVIYGLYRAGFRLAQFSYNNAPFTTYQVALAAYEGFNTY